MRQKMKNKMNFNERKRYLFLVGENLVRTDCLTLEQLSNSKILVAEF